MQQSQPSAVNQSHSPLVDTTSRTVSVLTRKRVSLFLTGVFLFMLALATTYESSGTIAHGQKQKPLNVQRTASTSANNDSSAAPDISASGTDPPPSQPENQTQVSVNGQDISIPSQGSTSRTIVSNDGHTTVNVSNSSSSTQGSSNASSSNTLNLNVNSNSSSSGSSAN